MVILLCNDNCVCILITYRSEINNIARYRVDSTIGSGNTGEQTQRSAAPPSVTLDKPLSDKNVYYNTYNAHKLPLDGDFDR